MDADSDNNDGRNNFGSGSGAVFPQSFTCPCPDGPEISPSPRTNLDRDDAFASSKTETFPSVKYYQKPRKKRSKLVKIEDSVGVSKPKIAKKPNPDAPKITMPCTECGKRFWSWKALFGHMRCHPERQWRGINPPPCFKPNQSQGASTSGTKKISIFLSEDDHEVATSLLILANGPCASESPTVTTACNVTSQGTLDSDNGVFMSPGEVDADGAGPSGLNCNKFECSSCKKVFGSHQALGGHRASHKNVKGCFAINRNEGEEEAPVADDKGEVVKDAGEEDAAALTVFGHKCSICLRVFSSGQALGGHKRCHWEKGDEPSGVTQDLNNPYSGKEGCGLDLNLPAPVEDVTSCSYSTEMALDLRLGL